MKKNVVGHMMAAKEPVVAKIRRWNILPKLVCILLALLFWLAVVNLQTPPSDTPPVETGTMDGAS